ncbi:hypothetical protein ABK040_012916 [Willaertia magna]
MLTLTVEPGYSMGNFRIGMPISEAIQYLKHYVDQMNKLPKSSELVYIHQPNNNNSSSINKLKIDDPTFSIITIDDNQMNKVDILYNDKNPLNNDILVKIVEEDIILYFESKTQRLKLIQINDVTKVKLSYSGIYFSGPTIDASFVNIYQVFGPTYPGEFDDKTNSYILTYPGLTFVFPIPSTYINLYKNKDQIPMEFPNNTTPIATTIYLFHGHDLKKPKLPPTTLTTIVNNNINDAEQNIEKKKNQMKKKLSEEIDFYFEPIEVFLGKYILFKNRNKKVKFGYSTQDVLMILGPPDRVYYKRNDKLKIHAVGAGQQQQQQDVNNTIHTYELKSVGNDYFYNYFSLGIDIMFHGTLHCVQKIILHTNFPGSVDFNNYVKCNFILNVKEFTNKEEDNKYITPDDKFNNIQNNYLKDIICSKPI